MEGKDLKRMALAFGLLLLFPATSALLLWDQHAAETAAPFYGEGAVEWRRFVEQIRPQLKDGDMLRISSDVFGGTTDFDQNRHLMMMATQRFPNPSKVYQVLLKLAFETITVTATHHHDGGDDSGKSATTIEIR